MLFVNEFCSHLKWYVAHDMPEFCLQKCLSFQYEPCKHLPIPSQQLEQLELFTVNKKDIRTTLEH